MTDGVGWAECPSVHPTFDVGQHGHPNLQLASTKSRTRFMSACPSRDQLEQLLSGQLSTAEHERISTHVESCESCQRVLEALTGNATKFMGPPGRGAAVGPQPADDFLLLLRGSGPPLEETVDHVPRNGIILQEGQAALEGPRTFGDYELLDKIARGGMGVVFRALQKKLHRVVALKMILTGDLASGEEVRRFYQEAEAAAQLDHPGIVPVFEVGEIGGQHFFSMGFVEGGSLATRIAKGPLPPREAAELIRQVAEAVGYAHQKGIIHRDLKPGNILLDKEGHPKVTDFGLAKQVKGASQMTMAGQIMGTPSYMPPEQAAGKTDEVGPAADIYSTGAVLYCLLTGHPPFQAAHAVDTLRQVLHEEPVSPRQLNPAVGRDLETICLKCLQKDPAKRYGSATELANDVRRYLVGEPIRARPVGRPERLWRWCRRNPLVATLLAGIAVSLFLGTVVASYFAVQAHHGEQLALSNARRADQSRRLSDRRWYAAEITLAQQAWREARLGVLRARLDALRPAPDAEDLRGFEWYFLQRLLRTDLITLSEHKGAVQCVAFRSDGRQLIAGGGKRFGREGEVVVWDTITGQSVRTLRAHASEVLAVAYSPDGRRFATACRGRGQPGEAKVWDADTGQELLVLTGHAGEVACVAFGPEGRLLATGGGCSGVGEVMIWNAATGQELRTLRGHADPVRGVAFRPDGRLTSASDDETLKEWDVTTGTEIRTLRVHFPGNASGSVTSLTYSADGRRLAAGYGDFGAHGEVKVWDTATGQELLTLRGHTSQVTGVVFRPDGRELASASQDNTIRIWDTVTGQEVLMLRGHSDAVMSVVYSPDGRQLASASADGTVKLWDATAPQETVPLRGHSVEVNRVAYSPDGRLIASAGSDHTIRIWDSATARARLVLRGHQDEIQTVVFSPDGTRIVSAGSDALIRVWDTATGKPVYNSPALPGSTRVQDLAFRPDGRRLAAVGTRYDESGMPLAGAIQVWDLETRKVVFALDSPTGIYRAAYSRDGRRLVVAGTNPVVRLLDADTGEERTVLRGHVGDVWSLTFDPRSERIACAGQSGVIDVWDVPNDGCEEVASPRLTLPGHAGQITRVVYSADGSRLVSASGGYNRSGGVLPGEVKFWDAATGQEMITLRGFRGAVYDVALRPDGRQIVTATPDPDADRKLLLWQAADLTEDVLTQRQARNAVRFWFAKQRSCTDVLERLRTDVTLSEPVRQQALALAEQYPPDPLGLAEARQTVRRPTTSRAEYYLARKQALEASRLDPDNSSAWTILGMAWFRVERYADAEEALTRAERCDKARGGPTPTNLAFLAMAQQHLGRKVEARATLERLRRLMKESRWANDDEAKAALREAEAVFAAKAP